MITTRPSPDSRSAANAARTTWNAPVRLVSTSLLHSSSEKRSARWIVSTTPALATIASQPPSSATAAATPASTAARSRMSKSSTARPATGAPRRSSSAAGAEPIPPRAPVTMTRRPAGDSGSSVSLEPIALPVAVGDVGRVLVPVPGARVAVEVAGRVARVDGVADPADREDLVHERAVRAVDREALAVVGPVVLALHDRVRVVALVAPHPPQPLPGPARVHPERHLLVVLGHRERARVRAGPAARVCAPRRRQQLDDLPAVAAVDRLDAALPVALHRPALGLADRLLAAVLLDPRQRRGDAVDHHVVQEAPLVLHRLARCLRTLEVAGLDRFDRPVHRRPRQIGELVVAEPALRHLIPPCARRSAGTPARRADRCRRPR